MDPTSGIAWLPLCSGRAGRGRQRCLRLPGPSCRHLRLVAREVRLRRYDGGAPSLVYLPLRRGTALSVRVEQKHLHSLLVENGLGGDMAALPFLRAIQHT